MKKIYLVTSGEYSDYSVDAVFSTEELAQAFIDSFAPSAWSRMDIEEFNLDPFEKEIKQGYYPFFVRITKEGKATEVEKDSSSYGVNSAGHGFDIYKNLYVHVYAKDKIHAIKIANKKRVQIIASNEWPI